MDEASTITNWSLILIPSSALYLIDYVFLMTYFKYFISLKNILDKVTSYLKITAF